MGERKVVRSADNIVQLRTERPGSWTRSKREEFLSELALTANVTASAIAVGMSEQGAYKLRRRDAGFRAAWQEALGEGYARLELMMLERAIFGSDRPMWHGGKEVGKIHEISDRLGLSLLAQHRAAATRDVAKAEPVDLEAAQARVRLRFEVIASRLAQNDGE